MKVWDAALDHGPVGIITSLSVLQLLCKTVFTDRKCPVDSSNLLYCDYLLAHNQHMYTDLNSKMIFSVLKNSLLLVIAKVYFYDFLFCRTVPVRSRSVVVCGQALKVQTLLYHYYYLVCFLVYRT